MLARGELWQLVAFTLLLGASQGVITIVRGAVPLALFGAQGYGAVLGLIATPILLVNAFSPALFALIVDRVGWQIALYALLACSIADLARHRTDVALVRRRPASRAPSLGYLGLRGGGRGRAECGWPSRRQAPGPAVSSCRPLRSRMLWSTRRGAGGAGRLLAQEPLGRRHRHVDGGSAHLVDRLRLGAGDLVLGQPGAPLQRVLERGPRLLREGLGLAAGLVDDGLGLLRRRCGASSGSRRAASAPPRAGGGPRRAPCGSPRRGRRAPWRSAGHLVVERGSPGTRRTRSATQNSAICEHMPDAPTPPRAAPAPWRPRPC